jgi:hypothetical protein
MSGQIAGMSVISLELMAVIVVVSMVAGTADLLRQPGWAWRRAGENKAAYGVLVALVPLVGLGMYLRTARPPVTAIAAAGRAASLPFEQFGEDADDDGRLDRLVDEVAAPRRFALVDATTVTAGEIRLVDAPPDLRPPVPFRAGPAPQGTAAGTAPAPVGLSTGYRPHQRPSVAVPPPAAAPGTGTQATGVPAGWKADPTGRHQFRYWGGSRWTDDVADDGEQSQDASTS